jgi:hypothetical protein
MDGNWFSSVLIKSAGSSAGEGMTQSIVSPAPPALSAEKLAVRKGSAAAKQKLAITAKDVKTVISTQNSLFPLSRIIASVYTLLLNNTRQIFAAFARIL